MDLMWISVVCAILGGLVVVYRCPHCNANIKISKETNESAVKTCQYCGATLKTLDLIEYLKSALS